MKVVISFEEIDAHFAGKWVLVTDIESDPGPVFRRGRVVWISSDQDECWQYAIDHHVGDCGVFYAGPWSAEDEPVPIPTFGVISRSGEEPRRAAEAEPTLQSQPT